MEPYFIFKNISSLDMGMLVNELPPITKPARDINKVGIPGRDGFLTEDLDTYQGTVKPAECTLLDFTMLDQVISWLDGSGEVIFSNQPDRKYQASIINQIPFTRFARKWRKFVVIFDCQPFARMIDNNIITLTAPSAIYGAGTRESRPIIKVYGTGAISLTINSKTIQLTNIVEHVTIDSELTDCYKNTVLMNNNMNGDFPTLQVGTNTISWTGTVTKIEITPNWRWL